MFTSNARNSITANKARNGSVARNIDKFRFHGRRMGKKDVQIRLKIILNNVSDVDQSIEAEVSTLLKITLDNETENYQPINIDFAHALTPTPSKQVDVLCPRFMDDSDKTDANNQQQNGENSAGKDRRWGMPRIAAKADEKEVEELLDFVNKYYTNQVTSFRKYSIAIQERLELARFPFDRQLIKVELQSWHKLSEWKEEVNAEGKGRRYMGTPGVVRTDKDWEGKNICITNESTLWKLDWAETIFFTEDRSCRVLVVIAVSRLPSYYIYSFIIVLFIIVESVSCVVAIPPFEFYNRTPITFTLLLTVVAFKFVMSSLLPKIDYLTTLDRYVHFATVILTLTIAENFLVAGFIFQIEHVAVKIDYAYFILFNLCWLSINAYLIIGGLYEMFYLDWDEVIKKDQEEAKENVKEAPCTSLEDEDDLQRLVVNAEISVKKDDKSVPGSVVVYPLAVIDKEAQVLPRSTLIESNPSQLINDDSRINEQRTQPWRKNKSDDQDRHDYEHLSGETVQFKESNPMYVDSKIEGNDVENAERSKKQYGKRCKKDWPNRGSSEDAPVATTDVMIKSQDGILTSRSDNLSNETTSSEVVVLSPTSSLLENIFTNPTIAMVQPVDDEVHSICNSTSIDLPSPIITPTQDEKSLLWEKYCGKRRGGYGGRFHHLQKNGESSSKDKDIRRDIWDALKLKYGNASSKEKTNSNNASSHSWRNVPLKEIIDSYKKDGNQ
eukprot:gene9046-12197_t